MINEEKMCSICHSSVEFSTAVEVHIQFFGIVDPIELYTGGKLTLTKIQCGYSKINILSLLLPSLNLYNM